MIKPTSQPDVSRSKPLTRSGLVTRSCIAAATGGSWQSVLGYSAVLGLLLSVSMVGTWGSAGCASSASDTATTRPAVESEAAGSPEHRSEEASLAKLTMLSESASVRVYEWEFNNETGRLYATPHYHLASTAHNETLLRRLPEFLEDALKHYRSAIVELPEPAEPMAMYLLGDRAQWEAFTRELMGEKAEPYLRIGRGGFTTNGSAVLYDIGVYDTLAIAAHEGWHQYTQSTFKDRLPVWFEEGLATYMEGHRFSMRQPQFRPWANIERFEQLRRAHANARLLSLGELLSARPEELLAQSRESVLDYYAQVWALIHFMERGSEGRYKERFHMALTDAASGQLRHRVRATLRQRGRSGWSLSSVSGPGVFLAYFTDDLDSVDEQYQAFIAHIVSPGARRRVRRGLSPIASIQIDAQDGGHPAGTLQLAGRTETSR